MKTIKNYININMADLTASYETPLDFAVYFFRLSIHNWRLVMFEGLYLHYFHILCLINVHISVYQHGRYDYRLWNILSLDVFFEFHKIIKDLSSLKCCIFTTDYVSGWYQHFTLSICQMWLQVRKVIWFEGFFWFFHQTLISYTVF